MAPLNIYYQNVRGLRTKANIFLRNVLLNSYDIICITESWLLDGICDSELVDERYLVWRRDRNYSETGQSLGGGVLIAIKRELVSDCHHDWCSSAEDLWITLSLRRSRPQTAFKIHICCIYICGQNQGYSMDQQLINFSDKLSDIVTSHPNDCFIVLGDFNLPNVAWCHSDVENALTPTNIAGTSQTIFFDNINFCNLQQYNSITNVNSRLLDLIFSNNNIEVHECDIPLVEMDSHHPPLCITTNFAKMNTLGTTSRIKYLYDEANSLQFPMS